MYYLLWRINVAVNIYIDESGSMTKNYAVYKPFFVVSIVVVKDDKKLSRLFKRFISKNLKTLKKLDENNKMFHVGKFHEIKGSELNSAMKETFIQALCKGNCFEVYYIKLLNSKVDDNFFDNTARAFNYLLKIFMSHALKKKYISRDIQINLQIDERNVKTQAKYQLAEYLNTELILSEKLIDKPLTVTYFDSANNKFIQVADVLSNIFFSHCVTNAYDDIINKMKEEKYLKEIFVFPPKVENK